MVNKQDFETLVELGKFTNDLMQKVREIPKVGTNLLEIVEFIENSIFDSNMIPAFPVNVCINNEAAHFTVFDEEVILKEGDLLKIDFGVANSEGLITDNAITVEIGNLNKHEKIIRANKEVLNSILKLVEVGTTLSEIGDISDKTAQKFGFNTIHNLCGHQIKRFDLHAGLSIPNYNTHSKEKLTDNSMFAIEPFLSYGEPKIVEGKNGNILTLQTDKPVRDSIAKKVLKEIINNYSELPFSKRWLVSRLGFDKKKVLYALRVLKQNGNIYEYPVLVSSDGSDISQTEHCVVFHNGEKEIITASDDEKQIFIKQ